MNGFSWFPFNIILYNFDFYNFAEKRNLGIPQAVPDHALLLEVYGTWSCPRWFWPPETN